VEPKHTTPQQQKHSATKTTKRHTKPSLEAPQANNPITSSSTARSKRDSQRKEVSPAQCEIKKYSDASFGNDEQKLHLKHPAEVQCRV
jgi:hypothetical protein